MKSPKVVIFLTVFIYLVGFGMIIPMMPILAQKYGATATQVGLLLAIFSAMQFLFSPFWGRLSDRIGRKKILVFCLFGEGLSYLLFAAADNFMMLLLARALCGFFGASISTASAAISDVTTEADRSKGMALIGAAFGLGFLVGPAIGGGLTALGETLSKDQLWAISFASYVVAGLCFMASLFAYFFFSDPPERKKSEDKTLLILQIGKYLKKSPTGALISVFFIGSLAMSIMEATLILYMGEKFAWGVKEVSFGFVYIGLISIFSQGFLVRKLLPILGEPKMLKLGLVMFTVGLTIIGVGSSIALMALAMTVLALGNSFMNPALLGSVSLTAASEDQGVVLGTTQGTASLGRVAGPIIGGIIYQHVGISMPFFVSGGLGFFALILILSLGTKLPNSLSLKGAV